MCTIINHKDGYNCTGNRLFISGIGIQGGVCGEACKCERERCFNLERIKIEKEFETLKHQQSYPYFQIKELKRKYNITN